MGARVYFIVAGGTAAGKSSVAAHLAARLGLPARSTSAVIAAELERERGWPAGTVASDRATDRDAHRADLVRTGDAMAAAGRPPGVVAVVEGARIVDGIRRGAELRAAMAAARSAGLTPFVLGIERPGGRTPDNTEADELAQLADVRVVNDGSLAELLAHVEAAIGLSPA